MLRGRLQQGGMKDVERPETNAKLVKRLPVLLFECSDRSDQGTARQHAAGVGEHCSERANAR